MPCHQLSATSKCFIIANKLEEMLVKSNTNKVEVWASDVVILCRINYNCHCGKRILYALIKFHPRNVYNVNLIKARIGNL